MFFYMVYQPKATRGTKTKRNFLVSQCKREKLLIDHWGIATALARNYRNIHGLDFDDVLQHARIALARATQSYQDDKNTSFSTYAWRVISNELNSLHARQIRLTRIEVEAIEEHLNCEDNEMYRDEKQDVHHSVHYAEARLALIQAISKLPQRMKVVVQGVLAQEDYQSIGKDLGFSRASSKTLVSRAYKRCLKILRCEMKRKGFSLDI